MPSHMGRGMHVPYLDRGPKALSEYHTITNLPFEIKSKISSRYTLMNRPSSANLPFLAKSVKECGSPRSSVMGFTSSVADDDDFKQSGIEYAKFLREHERSLGPNGFLDSRKYAHTYNVSSMNLSPRGGHSHRRKREPPSVVALTNRIDANQSEFAKQVKVIEHFMWRHKQEDKDVKRIEGDVNKSKKAVHRTLKEFETAISKRAQEEEHWVSGLGTNTENTRSEEQISKQKRNSSHADMSESKRVSSATDVSREYRSKITEFEMRKDQIRRMTRDFEEKLKQEEIESYNLAKKLANISTQMNTEAMRGRMANADFKKQDRSQVQKYINENKAHQTELDKKLNKSDGVNRASENRRRQASANLKSHIAHLSERSREGDRRVTDNKNSVESNIAAQKKLQEAAEASKLDKQKKEYERIVQAHELRKRLAIRKVQCARKKSAQERQANWEKTFDFNYSEFQGKRYKQLLGVFGRIVKRDNEIDQRLHQKCKQHDTSKKSQEQNVKKLEEQLIKTRAKNTGKIRGTMTEIDEHEKQLAQKALLAQAGLSLTQNQRSMAEWRLRMYRGAAKETEHIQKQLIKENKRLTKVGARTDNLMLEQQAIVA